MGIQLFGRFAIHADPPIQLQTNKIRGLVAYLAVHANRPIERTQLAYLFWPEKTDAVAVRNLRNSLSRLRKAFAPLAEQHVLTITRRTVQLSTSPNVYIDVVQFDQLWGRYEREPQIETLHQLVALYQGELLAGLQIDDSIEFDSWVTLLREKYHRQMLRALEWLVEGEIGVGALASAEKHAHRALTLEGWHETAHRQLIQIYRLGNRPMAAQAQFERCKMILYEEFGAEPNRTTVAALSLEPVVRAQKPVVVAQPPAPAHNLPRERNAFLGRESEVAQLQMLLAQGNTRLITLHGEGGIGKTRLARAAGASLTDTFTDGVCFVSLVGVNQPDGVTSAIIKARNVQLKGKKPAFEQLCEALRPQKALLIIDNLEHLIDEDEVVLDRLNDLLDAAPQLVLLVTSRQRLWLQAETVMRLYGLPYPATADEAAWDQFAAVQLFVERMQRLDAQFEPADQRDAIIEICQLVQGLPLAIELAAAQCSLRSCGVVVDELRHTLSLRTRMRDVPKRQRSLQNVFDYSWRLLDAELQPILARCAVMRGDFDYASFRTITNGQRDDLETFVAHALVRHVGNGRYDIHEMVRQNAVAQLETEERKRTQSAHAHYFLGLVAQYQKSYFYEIETMVEHVQREWTHIEQAWAWAIELEMGDLLCAAVDVLSTFWVVHGSMGTSRPMITAALAPFQRKWLFNRAAKATTDQLLAVRIWLDWETAEFEQLEKVANAVFFGWRSVHPTLQFAVVYTVGLYYSHTDNLSLAFECLDELWEEMIEDDERPHARFHAGVTRMHALLHNQRLAEAQAQHDALEPLIAHEQARHWSVYQRGRMDAFTWRSSQALAAFQRHNAWLSRLRGGSRVANENTTEYAMTLYRLGRFQEAVDAVIEDEEMVASDFSDVYTISSLHIVCLAYRRLGDIEQALHFGRIAEDLEESHISQDKDAGRGGYGIWTCTAYGLALCAAGEPIEAQKLLVRVRKEMTKGELSSSWYMLLEGSLAHCYAEAGHWHAAYELVDEIYAGLISAESKGDESHEVYTHLEQTWFCYKILHRFADPRAEDLIQHARNVLDFRLNRLALEHRKPFIDQFHEHREILRLTDPLRKEQMFSEQLAVNSKQ